MNIKSKAKFYFIFQWFGLISYLALLLWRFGIGVISVEPEINVYTVLIGLLAIVMGISFFSLLILFIQTVREKVVLYLVLLPWPKLLMIVLLVSFAVYLFIETNSYFEFVQHKNKDEN